MRHHARRHRSVAGSTCSGCGRWWPQSSSGALFVHTRRARPQRWDLGWIRSLVTSCRDRDLDSLVGLQLDTSDCPKLADGDRQRDPARAAVGLLHARRHPRRRIHRDRPLRRQVPTSGQPFRPHRHPATLAAGSGLGSPDRAAAVCAASPHRRRLRRNPQGSNRTGRLSGERCARGRARPATARRRAPAPVRRRPTSPRTRRPAVAGDETPRWVGQHRHHDHPLAGVQRGPQAAARRTRRRRRRTDRPGSGVRRRRPRRRQDNRPNPAPPVYGRGRPRAGRPGQSRASGHRARPARSWTARHVGSHRAHRPPRRRGDRCPVGLPGPIRRAADVLARPNQGRQL